MKRSRYILVSAVKNEAAYIAATADAVVSQTLLPERWIVVDDGSTDATREIVRAYQRNHPFVVLVKRKAAGRRDFSSQVISVDLGIATIRAQGWDFDYLGMLDGDITFSADYYQALVSRMEENPSLGICGGDLYDIHQGQEARHSRRESAEYHVSGAVQFFRRECFASIGGYERLRYGGQDVIACYAARLHGWKVRSYADLIVQHHKSPMGKRPWQRAVASYKEGQRLSGIGVHPVYALARGCYRVTQRPVLLFALAFLVGYLSTLVRWGDRVMDREVVAFIRREELRLLRAKLARGSPGMRGS